MPCPPVTLSIYNHTESSRHKSGDNSLVNTSYWSGSVITKEVSNIQPKLSKAVKKYVPKERFSNLTESKKLGELDNVEICEKLEEVKSESLW